MIKWTKPQATSARPTKEQLLIGYNHAGYALTQLNGKKPIRRNWPDTQHTENIDPSNFSGNFGVVLKDDDLVVDIDPRNFKDADVIEKLVKTIGKPLASFTVKTGGGGFHVYYKKPPELRIKKDIKGYEGIEFKTKGAQVVGAGCIHPNTNKEYIIVYGSLGQIVQAPDELLFLIKTKNLRLETGMDEAIDDAQSVSRFSEFLVKRAPLAIEGEQGDKTTFKVACRGRDYGLSAAKTYALMQQFWNPFCQPPWKDRELKVKVNNAYAYNEDALGKRHPLADFEAIQTEEEKADPDGEIRWDMTDTGILKKTLNNTVNFFRLKDSDIKDLLRYNEFTHDIECVKHFPWQGKSVRLPKLWDDSDAINCKYYLSNQKHFDVPTMILHEAALVLAKRKPFHPVRNYIKSLEWDGKPRLDTWLCHYAGAEANDYVRTVGKKVLVAALARIFNPGCKFDYVLVLEGKQGVGKSTLCEILGGEWFGDITLDTHNKDTIDAMRGKWIIEASEMEVSRRSETQALKAFITRRVDRVRLAYAKAAKDFPRQCIFIGTTNPESEAGYLKDTTGNRRFWPVHVPLVKMTELAHDVDQLWAEAYECFKNGEELYITDLDISNYAQEEANKRRLSDPWLDIISEFIALPVLDTKNKSVERFSVTAKEIWEDGLGGIAKQFSRREQVRINQCLSQLGWKTAVAYDKNIKQNRRAFIKTAGAGIVWHGGNKEDSNAKN